MGGNNNNNYHHYNNSTRPPNLLQRMKCPQLHQQQPKKKNRMMDRDGAFKQSFGRWNIRRVKVGRESMKLYLLDPFHTIIHMSLIRVLLIMGCAYTLVMCIWAFFYMLVPQSCDMNIKNFTQAFYFSLITLSTIGYGAGGSSIYFNDCISPLIIITSQALAGILLNALAIGIIFQRFSRAQGRANTVIFTNYACIRRIRGHLYFMFQVCEMRKHQLLEAHVRCYAIRHDRAVDYESYFQSYPMRLQHPDDDTGGFLLMTLPSVVVHRLDNWSPLLPASFSPHISQHQPAHSYLFPEPLQREADVDAGNREKVCHNNYHNKNHLEECSSNNIKSTNSKIENQRLHSHEIDRILQYWKETGMEVVVLVEGIDAATSSTIQARHSYKMHEILFDHAFTNCVSYDEVTGAAVINFNEFHEMTPCDFECITVKGTHY